MAGLRRKYKAGYPRYWRRRKSRNVHVGALSRSPQPPAECEKRSGRYVLLYVLYVLQGRSRETARAAAIVFARPDLSDDENNTVRRSSFRISRSPSSFETSTWPKKLRFETASDSRVNRGANRPLYERNFRRRRVSWNGGIAERVDTKTTNSRRAAKTDPRAARSKNQQTWKKEK